jgi:uracil-DNA glycosylase family 4
MTLDSQRLQRLAEMGIVSWQQRQSTSASPEATIPITSATASQEHSVPSSDIETLRAQVRDCQQCELHQSRTQTVFGSGSLHAKLFIIGEAPGADEDASGEPFVGRAGKLLNSMLEAIGLQRDEVYIANILKCRPPGNRDPKPEEVAECSGYLNRQINLVAPQLILAIGRVAAQNLLGVSTPIGKLRGGEYQHPGSSIPVLITYHPAYLLRSPREKRKAWDDLKRVAVALGI